VTKPQGSCGADAVSEPLADPNLKVEFLFVLLVLPDVEVGGRCTDQCDDLLYLCVHVC
jgi:hypothetical protein